MKILSWLAAEEEVRASETVEAAEEISEAAGAEEVKKDDVEVAVFVRPKAKARVSPPPPDPVLLQLEKIASTGMGSPQPAHIEREMIINIK